MEFLKHFLFEVREWFADMEDHAKLVVVEGDIANLKKELDPVNTEGFEWEHSLYWRNNVLSLEMCSDERNKILHRIHAREIRHHRMVAH